MAVLLGLGSTIYFDPWKLGAQFPEKRGPVDGGVKAPFSKI